MIYCRDNKAGRELSILGFGCMRFQRTGTKINMALAEQLIVEAVTRGVNYFDTAYSYEGSEEALGAILAKTGLRDRVYIATKLPHGKCRHIDDVERIFSEELRRLQTDRIDYYLIHNMAVLEQWERLCGLGLREWIAAQKAAGRIDRIGFSFHGARQAFIRLLEAYDWDFVQIQYNYLNEHYQAGAEGLRAAAARGLPVIVMEPLLGGRLARAPASAQAVMEQARPGSTAVSWALRWLWRQPEVSVVLSGMNAMEQLTENCALASGFTGVEAGEEEAFRAVQAAYSADYRVLCTGCGYCMPCPIGISIPDVLNAYNASYTSGLFTGLWQYVTSSNVMTGRPRYASDCTGCGRCETKCPQNIPIPATLRRVRRRLQPPGFKTAVRIVVKLFK